MSTSCFFCDTLAAAAPPPGGWVLREELVTAWIHPGAEYPGWYVLQLNRHCDGYIEMTADEAAAVGRACRTLALALHRLTGGYRYYQYAVGEVHHHFHMLIGPPPDGGEPGKALLVAVANRDPAYLDAGRAYARAAEVAAVVRELTSGSADAQA
jgi:diadenosine tetraphosphate (Ap4A) HIT family hydrolase